MHTIKENPSTSTSSIVNQKNVSHHVVCRTVQEKQFPQNFSRRVQFWDGFWSSMENFIFIMTEYSF